MTYKDLLDALSNMSEYQLDCDITVELGLSDECAAAELRICGEEHDILDNEHPVIYLADF